MTDNCTGDPSQVSQPIVLPVPTLRAAALETLLSGALLIADVRREQNSYGAEKIKASEQRFSAALEMLREALA